MMAQHNHVSHLNVFRKFEDVMRFLVINKIQNQIDHLSSQRFLQRRFGRASMETYRPASDWHTTLLRLSEHSKL